MQAFALFATVWQLRYERDELFQVDKTVKRVTRRQKKGHY
jgi:hypothetical protein